MTRRALLNTRHKIATASDDALRAAGGVARALAWQVGDELSVCADLEVACRNLATAQRTLHEAIAELRLLVEATEGDDR